MRTLLQQAIADDRHVTLSALSIRARVLLLLAVVAVPYFSYGIYEAVLDFRHEAESAEAEILAIAGYTASALEQFLAVAERSTGSLASERGGALLDRSRCGEVIHPLGDAFPFFANVLVADSTGRVVCDARGGSAVAHVSGAERYWFQTVRDTREFTVGRPVVGPITEDWVVVMASPILDDEGGFLGAVAGTVQLVRLKEILKTSTPGPDQLLTITTDDGVVVARSIEPELWVGRPLPSGTVEVERRGITRFITRTEDAAGLPRVWGRVDLPRFGWRVYTGVPSDSVYADVRAKLLDHTSISVLALLGTILIGIYLFRGISGSFHQLSEGVRTAEAGHAVAIPPGAPPEVVSVVSALNRALDKREEAEESERKARDRLESLVDHAVFGVYVSTVDGRFLRVNRALVDMLGYDSADELMEVGTAGLYRDPDLRAELVEAHKQRSVIENVEVDWLTRGGHQLTVRLNGRVILTSDGIKAFEVIVEDITEQRALERLARHQQKMEAVGRLAGGVAHEFNNLLTVLGVNSELIRDSLGPEHDLRAEVDEISSALERARALTRKLLAFSRKEVTQPTLLDVGQVVHGLEGMLHRVLGDNIRLETRLAQGTRRVLLDPGQMEQIILNLVLNARDALGLEGGRITISTSTRAGYLSGDAEDAAGLPRWFTVLTVADNGPGMDDQIRDLVFEPFFTTKPPGIGTGLGLPTVYGIAADAGGRVELETEPGAGAVFRVWLPVADAELDGTALPGRRGDGTVIVALRGAALRAIARRALEAAGYEVLAASDGPGALDHFWKHHGPVRLLVTEPDLPEVSGEPLLQRLRREAGDLPVLFLSADPPDDESPHVGFPFDPWELAQAAETAMGQR